MDGADPRYCMGKVPEDGLLPLKNMAWKTIYMQDEWHGGTHLSFFLLPSLDHLACYFYDQV